MKKMKRSDIEDYAKQSGENLILIDGHDDAIIGICQKFNSVSVLYDKDKIIKKLAKHMDYDDALEYFDFNIVGAYLGDETPTFLINEN